MNRYLTMGLCVVLPLVGVYFSEQSISDFFSSPPIPIHPGISSFSKDIFVLSAIATLGCLIPFIWRVLSYSLNSAGQAKKSHPGFPWWGWIALGWTLFAWILAWNRFSWFTSWQAHTFFLLWFGYVFGINALTYSSSGQCLLLSHSTFFFKLFPLSAAFWWYFEYLNQFVNNWHYANLPNSSQLQYVLWTSLSFSTVIPAVFSTREFLLTFPRLTMPFQNWKPLPFLLSRQTGWTLFGVGCMGLSLISIWPTILFPFLWISPLCILVGTQVIRNKPSFFDALSVGNWQPVVLFSMSALICGFWWELWNVRSLVHWEYSIPFVHGFQLFEMPILGYAGYLPFGLECLVITEWFLGRVPRNLAQQECSQQTPPSSKLEHSERHSISLTPTL